METLQSESIKHLAAALKLFQVKMGTIGFDSNNPFFKSKYASLTHILEEIKDPLIECDLVVTQFPTGNNGLITTLIHTETGEFMRSTYYMKPEKETPQNQGSVITYQRRYCLTAALGLCFDVDDDGNAGSGLKAAPVAAPAPKKENAAPVAAPAPDQDHPKKWLNEGTEIYKKAVEKLAAGQTTIKKIRDAFKVSKKTEAALLQAAGLIKPIIQD